MDKQAELKKLKKFGIENNIPNISEENAQYLKSILRELRAKSILEIGSANGYSTIHFALEVEKWGGVITSLEFSQAAYEMASENFEKFWVTNTIRHYFWDARDIIPLLDETYDFIFIDGLKKASLSFLKLVWDKALPWCVIVIDDVIKFRHKMQDLYTYLDNSHMSYKIIQIDDDDGIMVIKK